MNIKKKYQENGSVATFTKVLGSTVYKAGETLSQGAQVD